MNNNPIQIDIQKKERMTWNWIKQRLLWADYSFIELARLHGVKKSNLAAVKHHPCPKLERLIAESVGRNPWELWPDRYDADHNPSRISSRYQGHKRYLNNTRNNSKIKGKIE